MRDRGHRRRAVVGAAVILAAALGAAGCNIAGPIYAVLHGPEKRPAAYTLDPTLKTVFFIDDRSSHLPRRSLVNVMGTAAEEALLAAEAVEPANMIAALSTQRAASGEKYGDLMSVADVGRAVGADVVIYVSVEGFLLSRDGVTIEPLAQASVKVVSVVDDRRLWPEGVGGAPVRVAMRAGGTAPRERSKLAAIEIALAKSLGLKAAQLFFEHVPDDLEARREGP